MTLENINHHFPNRKTISHYKGNKKTPTFSKDSYYGFKPFNPPHSPHNNTNASYHFNSTTKPSPIQQSHAKNKHTHHPKTKSFSKGYL
jgi:hypothetical protein